MKDLFRLVFSKVSQLEYAEYHDEFVQRAPFWMLRAAALNHKDVGKYSGFADLYSYLEASSRECWNNPELYPHLLRILGRRDVESDTERELNALETHLGLSEVTSRSFTHRYFRRRSGRPEVFELKTACVEQVSEVILIADSGFPTVYLPLPGLFDDVVGGAARYDGSPLLMSSVEARRTILEAVCLMQSYDEELYHGFLEAIGSLAITGDRDASMRSSFSTGALFTGGIFASLASTNPIAFAESLVHEYYHQRIWLWWFIESPSDMPARAATMVSPVSHQERPIQVMMHALLIYCSLADFYDWASGLPSNVDEWVNIRSETLRTGAKELSRSLSQALVGRQECLRFVRAVTDYFA